MGEMTLGEMRDTLERHGLRWHGGFTQSEPVARRLAALEAVVDAARDTLAIHEDVACSCRGCDRTRTALATLRLALAPDGERGEG